MIDEEDQDPEVWITGIGLVSSYGQGVDPHWQALAEPGAATAPPVIEKKRFAPAPVHPLAPIDLTPQIPNKTDIRQMGPWQCLGTYAAGLALADAGFTDPSQRANIDLNVAAGNGERDAAADASVLAALSSAPPERAGEALNEVLLRALRPTLYLAELTNLLAGNIQIVHGVTASSRTFKGEEMAGVAAIENAVRRLKGGTGKAFLVGGACNAERADLLLNLELCGVLWRGEHRPVWERDGDGGGIVPGSMGAFLVLETAQHATARGKRPYARITNVVSARAGEGCTAAGGRHPGDVLMDRLGPMPCGQPLAVISGASGAKAATQDERAWLKRMVSRGVVAAVRAPGTMLGHGFEAHFPAMLALAALAVARQQTFAAFDRSGMESDCDAAIDRALVTAWGHWRGAGLGCVEAVGAASSQWGQA